MCQWTLKGRAASARTGVGSAGVVARQGILREQRTCCMDMQMGGGVVGSCGLVCGIALKG